MAEISIKGEQIIEIFGTCDGKHMFVTKRIEEDGEVFLFGYVKFSIVLDWIKFCYFSEAELKDSGNKVWKVAQNRWQLLPELTGIEKEEEKDKLNSQNAEGAEDRAGPARSSKFVSEDCEENENNQSRERADDSARKGQLNEAGMDYGRMREHTRETRTANGLSLKLRSCYGSSVSDGKNAGEYRQQRQGILSPGYARDYRSKMYMLRKSYLPIIKKLAGFYRRLGNTSKKPRYPSFHARAVGPYRKQQDVGAYSFGQALYRSLDSYLNNCKGVDENGMETYSLFD
jgi:uncharacterized protein YfiM (DUF2279 family)